MKTVWGFIIAVFLVAGLTLSLANAQTPVPTHQFNETNMHAPPQIFIYKLDQDWPLGWSDDNGWGGTDHPVVIYTDTGNVTLRIRLRIWDFPDPLYPTMDAPGNTFSNGYLTSVSYTASWQNNQTVQVFTNTTKNHPGQFEFNLTNVPYGYQVIHVYALCVITPYDCATASTYDIPQSSDKLLNFTVAAPPTPTPIFQNVTSPLAADSAILIGIIFVVLTVIALRVINRTKFRKYNQQPCSS